MAAPIDTRPSDRSPEALERLVGQVLKEQPLRPAPRALQMNVLAEIERRAALPWWHHSFLHWPLAVRALFVVASLGIAKLALTGVMLLVARIHSEPVVAAFTKPMSWAENSADAVSKTVSVASMVLNAIPSHWLYAGIALAATLYVALVALGATAYRTLYAGK